MISVSDSNSWHAFTRVAQPEPQQKPEGAGADRLDDPLVSTPYAAQSVLGRGAMGLVFLAKHRRLGTDVVVKVMLQELANHPDLVDRMRVEAQTLARLKSPHLVTCTDFDVTALGAPYLVTEYLQGRTVAQLLEDTGRLDARQAVELTIQILRGLSVAHAVGIVHRDVKPANLFVSTDPSGNHVLKVLDFGVAKVMNNLACVAPAAFMTATGSLVGTPRYCSPEQALGEEIDQRSDLYSVGWVLSALLTGRTPFQEKRGIGDVLIAQTSEVPRPPSFYVNGVPAELDAIVAKALEKAPSARYASAEDFIEALELARPTAATPHEASVRTTPSSSVVLVSTGDDTEPFGASATSNQPFTSDDRTAFASDLTTVVVSRFDDPTAVAPVGVDPIAFGQVPPAAPALARWPTLRALELPQASIEASSVNKPFVPRIKHREFAPPERLENLDRADVPTAPFRWPVFLVVLALTSCLTWLLASLWR